MPRGAYTAKRARTRRRILDAAAEVFSTRGYAAATLSDVAARAGVVPSTVTNHFATKEQLGLALVERWLGELEAAQRATREAVDDPAVRVALTVLRLLDLSERHALVAEILAGGGFPGAVGELRGRMAELATSNLVEGIERGRFRVPWSQSVLDFVTGFTVETMRSRVLGVLDDDAPAQVARIALLGLGLTPDEAEAAWVEAVAIHRRAPLGGSA